MKRWRLNFYIIVEVLHLRETVFFVPNRPMSHYSKSLNKVPMCPCSFSKDIPQEGGGVEENELVENGFEILSGESGSDEEQDALGDQGYVPLAQSEDETVVPDVIEEGQETPVYIVNPEPDEESTQPEAEKLNNETSSSSCAFSSTRDQMRGDEIDLIKSVMMNIKLPSSSIPEWAKRIPEEKWKAPLVPSLEQGSSSGEKSTEKKSS